VKTDGTGTLYVIQFLKYSSAKNGTQQQRKSDVTLVELKKTKESLTQDLANAKLAANQREKDLITDSIRILQNQLLRLQSPQTSGATALTPTNPGKRKIAPSSYIKLPVQNASSPIIDSSIGDLDRLYFTISTKDFAANVTDEFTYQRSFVVLSSLVLPYKMNFGNHQSGSKFDVNPNVTVGPAIGIRLRTSHNSLGTQAIDFLANIGISTIKVDQYTLPGIATESTNYPAFTIGGGIAYEFDKIQLGLFSGFDILMGNANHAYVYRYSPYLAFGIGFQIFSFKAAGQTQ
jgi:hypothetical protein